MILSKMIVIKGKRFTCYYLLSTEEIQLRNEMME